MGFLSKIFKGIKKFVKKIGRGIKKVARKIGKAVNKLGIVGQIGMMILMPYAAGAMSSFFGATGTLSNWGAALLKGPGIASKALGHTLNAINTVGTMAGQVYTGITKTIGKAWDVVSGKGTLADVGKSAKSIFTKPAKTLQHAFNPNVDLAGNLTGVAKKAAEQVGSDLGLDVFKPGEVLSGEGNITDRLYKGYENSKNLVTGPRTLQEGITAQSKEVAAFLGEGDLPVVGGETLLGPTKDAAAALQQTRTAGENIPDIVARSPSEKLKDIFQEGWEDAKTELRGKAVAKVKDTITREGMELMGLSGEGPQRQQGEEAGSYNLPYAYTKTDSGIDFTNSYVVDRFAKQGNNHLAYGLANLGHVSSIYDPNNNPTTNSFMTDYYLAPSVARQIGAA